MHGVGDGPQIAIRQDHPRRSLDMRGAHQLRLFRPDGRQHFGDRRRGEGGLGAGLDRPGLEHPGLGRNVAHLENLRPAVAEPAVADHQALLPAGQLARHRLHAEGAAAGHYRHGVGVVDLLEGTRDVVHHPLERLRHMVERAVGVDDRVFDQAIGIDIRVAV
ncbi:hypothetical protein D3C86_1546580 [compost metagenome]